MCISVGFFLGFFWALFPLVEVEGMGLCREEWREKSWFVGF